MTNLNFTIDKEKCIHCGLCIQDCMSCIIEFDEDKFPKIVDGGEKRCFQCQHCLAICPVGAISVFNKNPENSAPTENNINPDDMLNLIKGRRSCRYYKNENLPYETFAKLKEMLNYTPTGCNDRGLHFTFVEDAEVMKGIREYTISKLQKLLKPVHKGFLKKFAKYKDKLVQGEDCIYRNAPHMVVVSIDKNSRCVDIDPIIALSYFELYAQTLGLGTLWCGLAKACIEFMPALKEKLNIPNNYKISYVMLFGAPDISYKRSIQPNDYPSAILSDGNIKEKNFFQKMFD